MSDLARNAMLNLRGQRDTLIETFSTLRSMNTDLVKTEQVTQEFSMRKFTTLVVLILLAILLAIVILHLLYWKLTAGLRFV